MLIINIGRLEISTTVIQYAVLFRRIDSWRTDCNRDRLRSPPPNDCLSHTYRCIGDCASAKGGARVAQVSHYSRYWPVINVWYHRVVGFLDLHGRGCVCTGGGGVRVCVCVPEDVPTI